VSQSDRSANSFQSLSTIEKKRKAYTPLRGGVGVG
jgi:hypothetical protein